MNIVEWLIYAAAEEIWREVGGFGPKDKIFYAARQVLIRGDRRIAQDSATYWLLEMVDHS